MSPNATGDAPRVHAPMVQVINKYVVLGPYKPISNNTFINWADPRVKILFKN